MGKASYRVVQAAQRLMQQKFTAGACRNHAGGFVVPLELREQEERLRVQVTAQAKPN